MIPVSVVDGAVQVSEFNPMSESIHDWLLRYIKKQTMVESLDWIASQMKDDAADGYEYTKDVPQMNRIRKAWAEQMQHARQEQ